MTTNIHDIIKTSLVIKDDAGEIEKAIKCFEFISKLKNEEFLKLIINLSIKSKEITNFIKELLSIDKKFIVQSTALFDIIGVDQKILDIIAKILLVFSEGLKINLTVDHIAGAIETTLYGRKDTQQINKNQIVIKKIVEDEKKEKPKVIARNWGDEDDEDLSSVENSIDFSHVEKKDEKVEKIEKIEKVEKKITKNKKEKKPLVVIAKPKNDEWTSIVKKKTPKEIKQKKIDSRRSERPRRSRRERVEGTERRVSDGSISSSLEIIFRKIKNMRSKKTFDDISIEGFEKRAKSVRDAATKFREIAISYLEKHGKKFEKLLNTIKLIKKEDLNLLIESNVRNVVIVEAFNDEWARQKVNYSDLLTGNIKEFSPIHFDWFSYAAFLTLKQCKDNREKTEAIIKELIEFKTERLIKFVEEKYPEYINQIPSMYELHHDDLNTIFKCAAIISGFMISARWFDDKKVKSKNDRDRLSRITSLSEMTNIIASRSNPLSSDQLKIMFDITNAKSSTDFINFFETHKIDTSGTGFNGHFDMIEKCTKLCVDKKLTFPYPEPSSDVDKKYFTPTAIRPRYFSPEEALILENLARIISPTDTKMETVSLYTEFRKFIKKQ